MGSGNLRVHTYIKFVTSAHSSSLPALGDMNDSDSSLNNTLYPVILFSTPYKTIAIMALSCALLIGVVGNVAVIIVFAIFRQLRSPTNNFLFSLAISDIMILLVAALPFAAQIVSFSNSWDLGRLGCAMTVFFQYLAVNSSVTAIVMVSLERWLGICHHLRSQYLCTFRRSCFVLAVGWLANICYASAWIFLTKIEHILITDGSIKWRCTFRYQRHHYRIIYITDFVIFYCLPLLLTALFYSHISHSLHRRFHTRFLKISYKTKKVESGYIRQNSRIIKMLVVVVLIFAVSWLPYRGWLVYNSFVSTPYLDLWYSLFAKLMVYLNSAVNPIIYTVMSHRFRHAFKRFFSGHLENIDSHCLEQNQGQTRQNQKSIHKDLQTIQLEFKGYSCDSMHNHPTRLHNNVYD